MFAGSAFGQNTIQVFKSNGGTAVAAAAADFTLVGANSVNIHPAVAGFATDWFIRQTNVADAIDAVTFTVPQGTLATLNPGTVFHVAVGSSPVWNPAIVARELPGCSSLGSFTGFGQAGGKETDPSYFVQVRIGVSDFIGRVNNVGGIETNEIVRVDAKTIGTDPTNYNCVVTAHGPIGFISADEMTMQVTTEGRDTAAYDPGDDIPWPYSGSQRGIRFDVARLTTQELTVHNTPNTTGDININLSGNHDFDDDVFEVLARGHVMGKVHTVSRVNRVEGWKGIGKNTTNLQIFAGRSETIMAGKLTGTGQPDIAGSFENLFAVYTPVFNTDLDARIRTMRAVKKDGQGGSFETVSTLSFAGMRTGVGAEEVAQFDADFAGYMEISGDLPADQVIRIGDTHEGTIAFFQPDGLKGQIIVNRDNINGTWIGNIGVNGGFSNIPEYPQLSNSIGGGAVGEAPFRLHDEDCLPVNNLTTPVALRAWEFTNPTWAAAFASIYPPMLDQGKIRTRLYGPVKKGPARRCCINASIAIIHGPR